MKRVSTRDLEYNVQQELLLKSDLIFDYVKNDTEYAIEDAIANIWHPIWEEAYSKVKKGRN